VAIPDISSAVAERTRRLIRGMLASHQGYYGGKIQMFSDLVNESANNDPFPTVSCDIFQNETTTNQYGGTCGTTCSFHEVNAADWSDSNEEISVDARTCQREMSWFRGSWIRNISVQWRRVTKLMNVANAGSDGNVRGLPIQSSVRSATSNLLDSQFGTTSAPCKKLADDYIGFLNRIRVSSIWGTGAMDAFAGVSDAQCASVTTTSSGTDTNHLAACHLVHVRQAVEALFTYMAACQALAFAMDEHVYVMTQGGSGSVFHTLQDRMKDACSGVSQYSDFPPCYSNNVVSKVKNSILSGTHGTGYYQGDWGDGTSLPLTSGGQ
jgi:hypothetical protein